MKVKTFFRLCFGSFFVAMTGVNAYQSHIITSVTNSFWGIFTFVGMEIVILSGTAICYLSIAKERNLEEEM